ncbi:hypothetical protein C8R44DRAFT_858194 [Mycena epipterygia]|nr:hypothetical protein C8R44DRAFT_858194 [Mycena epipterygia]
MHLGRAALVAHKLELGSLQSARWALGGLLGKCSITLGDRWAMRRALKPRQDPRFDLDIEDETRSLEYGEWRRCRGQAVVMQTSINKLPARLIGSWTMSNSDNISSHLALTSLRTPGISATRLLIDIFPPERNWNQTRDFAGCQWGDFPPGCTAGPGREKWDLRSQRASCLTNASSLMFCGAYSGKLIRNSSCLIFVGLPVIRRLIGILTDSPQPLQTRQEFNPKWSECNRLSYTGHYTMKSIVLGFGLNPILIAYGGIVRYLFWTVKQQVRSTKIFTAGITRRRNPRPLDKNCKLLASNQTST